MKTIVAPLAVCLALFSLPVSADALDDHRAALRAANTEFTAAFEKCEDAAKVKERNRCRGAAKAQHTKAVERADKALTAAHKKGAAK